MEPYNFDTPVKRGPENMKNRMIPSIVKEHGGISLDGAEPDFATAPVIRDAILRLAENGLYGFTIPSEEYGQAVAFWMRESRGVSMETDWIVPTLGTIHALASLIRLLCKDPADGIVVMSPIYNRYKQAADRLGRCCFEIPLLYDRRYAIDFDALEQVLAKQEAKIFVLCNPHNPIGQIWPEEDLTHLYSLCKKHNVIIFSDEIFADNCYDRNRCPSMLEIAGGDNSIVMISLGKNFGMTGLNHANALISDPKLRKSFTKQRTADHYGSMDPLSYACTIAAFSPEGLAWVRACNDYVEENIRLVRSFFAKTFPDAVVLGGEGGYILWIDWRAYTTDEKKLLHLLETEAFVCVGEGSDYGCPGFTRICVAAPRALLSKALEGIGRVRTLLY